MKVLASQNAMGRDVRILWVFVFAKSEVGVVSSRRRVPGRGVDQGGGSCERMGMNTGLGKGPRGGGI